MTDTHRVILLTVILLLIAILFSTAGWAKWRRRRGRSVAELLHTDTDSGQPTTVVRGLHDQWSVTLMLAVCAGMFAAFAVFVWDASRVRGVTHVGCGLALTFGLVAGYAGIGVAYAAAGRLGHDQTLRLTRDGLTQHTNGHEVSVRWDQVTELAVTRGGVALHVDGTAQHRRVAPVLFAGRGKDRSRPWLVIPMTLIHHKLRIPVTMAILTWVADPASRSELGTPALAQRLLTESHNKPD